MNVLFLSMLACAGRSETPLLVVNEFLARNDTSAADEHGGFDDWLEIYNPGDERVEWAGLYLSDKEDDPTRWPLPQDGGIDPGEFVVIWCDGAPEEGELHTGFRLKGDGEFVGIYQALEGEEPVLVDGVTFGKQAADRSAARIPDGGVEWTDAVPTPGAPNAE